MATVTQFKAGGSATSSQAIAKNGGIVFSHDIDLTAKYGPDNTALADGDIIDIVTVPANTEFTLKAVNVVDAISGTTDWLLGDGTDNDEFVETGGSILTVGAATIAKATFTAGALLTTSDTMKLVITGTPTAGKINFVWEMKDFTSVGTARFPDPTH